MYFIHISRCVVSNGRRIARLDEDQKCDQQSQKCEIVIGDHSQSNRARRQRRRWYRDFSRHSTPSPNHGYRLQWRYPNSISGSPHARQAPNVRAVIRHLEVGPRADW